MKRLLSLILIFATLLALASCTGTEYAPVPSTDEESRVLMTFSFEGEKYELKYELYRALFLTHSETYDKGDKSFWATPEAESAIEEINETIVELSLDIFATIHLSKKIGYDPYSANAENKINEYIKESVEGGDTVKGYDGDYDAYLSSLKNMNLNYSVQTLLLRYSIAYDKILEYYKGTADADAPTPDMESGKLHYNENDVRDFYNGDESARISIVVFNAEYITKETVEQRRDKIASFSDITSALNYAVSFTSGDPEDILDGAVIGKNSMDSSFYSEVTSCAFSMDIGEVSPVISIATDRSVEYWVICKMEKTQDYLDENIEKVEEVYVSQKIGEILENVKTSIGSSKKTTEAFNSLDLSKISMD